MGPRPPASASQTELIRRLDAEWRVLAGSRLLRDRLRTWAADDERLAFEDGDEVVAAAHCRDTASWAERDKVLAALLEKAIDDALARRVALQVVLPGVKSLINGIRGWDESPWDSWRLWSVPGTDHDFHATEVDLIQWPKALDIVPANSPRHHAPSIA